VVAWQQQQDKVYGASSLLVVQPAPNTLAVAGARPDNLVFLARTYAAHFGTRPTMQTALAKAGLGISTDEGLRRTSVSVSTSDATITLETTGKSKADARALNAALEQTVIDEVRAEQDALRADRLAPLNSEISDLQRQIADAPAGSPERATAQQTYQTLVASRAQTETQPSDRVAVLSPAQAKSGPVAPHPLRNGLLAFLVVAALGAQLVVWRAVRRRATPPTGTPTPGYDAHRALTAPVVREPSPDAFAGAVAPAQATAAEDSAITRMARRPAPASTRAPRKTTASRPAKPRRAAVDRAEIAESS
jgi:hypothetical protein